MEPIKERGKMLTETTRAAAPATVIERLQELCSTRGLDGLAHRLEDLAHLVGDDMQAIETELEALPAPRNLVERSARRLLDLGGKRIRPLCVILASRVGATFDRRVLDLAVAVEMIHNATLLHDDVVDRAEERRGAPSVRSEFGNAASIFAGDWLLIEALQRVERAAVAGTLPQLLRTIAEMIAAESLQLENRGRIDLDRDLYFRIAEGKSAALFRWAMEAGGRAGGLDEAACQALGNYGLQLGVAFQVIDDLLDLTGDVAATGKELFADLREGKMTYPLIVAVERDPSLRLVLEEIVRAPAEAPSEALSRRVTSCLRESGAVQACQVLARQRAATAVRSLAPLPENEARGALAVVAESSIYRRQ